MTPTTKQYFRLPMFQRFDGLVLHTQVLYYDKDESDQNERLGLNTDQEYKWLRKKIIITANNIIAWGPYNETNPDAFDFNCSTITFVGGLNYILKETFQDIDTLITNLIYPPAKPQDNELQYQNNIYQIDVA